MAKNKPVVYVKVDESGNLYFYYKIEDALKRQEGESNRENIIFEVTRYWVSGGDWVERESTMNNFCEDGY